MLSDFVRQSLFGRTVYHLSGHKYFSYKEEAPDYVIPEKYLVGENLAKGGFANKDAANGSESSSISSEKTLQEDQKILVDWDGDDDPENPYNWPVKYKVFLIGQICSLTTAVYMGAGIYTPGLDEIMAEFEISQTVATLPLSLFVIGYGIGPMVFSPFSENAIFGRTNIYLATLLIFLILQIPTALSTNIAGLCILRFLAGFFASPCLATGGASTSDVLSMAYVPIGIATWSVSCVCGPTLGPLVGAALIVAEDWRWTFWFLAMTSAFALVMFTFFLPETYSKTILLRKAKRLRAITGNQNITTEDEIKNSGMTLRQVAIETLYRPLEVSIVEPVVLFINLYIALVYAIIYLWFECFPILFVGTYDFTLVELGLAYLSLLVGTVLACFIYVITVRQVFTKRMLRGDEIFPEIFIPFAIIASVLMPIGIFILAFTGTKSIHWIAPLFGAAIFGAGAFMTFQSLFNYLGMSFYRFLASVFAGNALFRSVIAGAFPLFGKALYDNLATDKYPVGWGSATLGFICVAAIAIPVTFYLNGPRLRARSKYSGP